MVGSFRCLDDLDDDVEAHCLFRKGRGSDKLWTIFYASMELYSSSVHAARFTTR